MREAHIFLVATGTLAVITSSTDFPQCFQDNDKMVPRLGHVHFLQNYLEYYSTNHPNITQFVSEDFMVFSAVALQPIVLWFVGTHNYKHIFGMTPLHKLSACRAGRYLHNTRKQEMNIHVSEAGAN